MGLYPLKFHPRFVPRMWGGRRMQDALGKPLPEGSIGESWELYDFPPGVVDDSGQWVGSIIANGPHAGRSLHWLISEFGSEVHGNVPLAGEAGQFPILLKYLDAREDLSVQVHPDEAYAREHPEAHLKSEAWYVVQAEPGARILKGLRPGTTRQQFREAIERGTVEQHINAEPARAGHCFYLPSGTVHALGAGTLVAEVQTPSDTTFRVFDFNRIDPSTGRQRTLHVEQALQCMDFSGRPEPAQPRSHVGSYFTTVTQLVSCPYFKLEKVRFIEGVEEAVPYDEPVVWMVLEGEGELQAEGHEPTSFTRGDTVLLPAAMKNPVLRTRSNCIWLEITFPT